MLALPSPPTRATVSSNRPNTMRLAITGDGLNRGGVGVHPARDLRTVPSVTPLTRTHKIVFWSRSPTARAPMVARRTYQGRGGTSVPALRAREQRPGAPVIPACWSYGRSGRVRDGGCSMGWGPASTSLSSGCAVRARVDFPAVLRHDNLSAATHELKRSGGRQLTARFQQRAPGKPHENGGAEQAQHGARGRLAAPLPTARIPEYTVPGAQVEHGGTGYSVQRRACDGRCWRLGLTSDTEPHRPAPALYVHAADTSLVGWGGGAFPMAVGCRSCRSGWGRSGNGTDLNTSAYQRTPGGGAARSIPRIASETAFPRHPRAGRGCRGGIVARPAQPERAARAPCVRGSKSRRQSIVGACMGPGGLIGAPQLPVARSGAFRACDMSVSAAMCHTGRGRSGRR